MLANCSSLLTKLKVPCKTREVCLNIIPKKRKVHLSIRLIPTHQFIHKPTQILSNKQLKTPRQLIKIFFETS